jgi:ABC-type bacteriocin/lantibiotic exporter with double-glycine peptidase domain
MAAPSLVKPPVHGEAAGPGQSSPRDAPSQPRPSRSGWRLLIQFLRRIKDYRGKAALVCLCGAAAGLLQLVIPVASAQLINRAIPGKNTTLLFQIVAALAAAAAGAVSLAYIESRLSCWLRERAVVTLQTRIFEHVQAFPHMFFKQQEVGYLLSRINADANTAIEILSNLVGSGRVLVVLVGGAALLPTFDPSLAVFILAILPVYCLLLVRFQRKTKQAFIAVSESTALTSRELAESLAGVNETKAYAVEDYRVRRFHEVNSERARLQIRGRMFMSAGTQITQGLNVMVSLAIIVWGAM